MTDATRAAIALANRQQGLASDPDVSAFVSASAGSGKTKLLIDRLLRLMLPRVAPDDPERRLVPGTDPARIQCLTFTKAAAAEMAIRLQRELGGWVTLDDAGLDDRLRRLGCEGGAALRQPARALFARVLDLPGGMRIGTIHAFCQSLLRRFPVEAEVSPHFRLVEDTDSRAALNRAWEEVLSERARGGVEDAALSLLAGQAQASDALRLLQTLQSKAPALQPVLDALQTEPERVGRHLRRLLALRRADEAACVLAGVSPPNESDLLAVLREAIAIGTPSLRKQAEEMADWLAQTPERRAETWSRWCGMFLTGKNEPRAAGGFVKGKLGQSHPHIAEALVAEAERIVAVEDERRAIRTVALTLALLELGGPVLRRYADGKRALGLVDYDDLIGRTLALLRDPGSAWVLYKLDGGIDHLLLDEVQDTSDLQWRIAHALTDEFFAGRGAGAEERSLPRTVFAVGDYKQSIYSFQDADPDAFHHWHGHFRDRVGRGGQAWREPELTVSFRSTVPVLALVDAVFAAPDAARGVQEPGRAGAIRHVSARPDAPGSVELWPLVPVDRDGGAGEAPDPADPWSAPRRNRSRSSAQQLLAEQLARFIAGEIGRRHETGGSPLSAGDVLVLVPRRSAFVRALIRALKAEGVPVATLVRTGLADQIAVRDLMALCDALLLPQDDLSVGCVLTSPIGGLSDDSLMALATERGERSLWEQLRERARERPDWGRAWDLLSSLFARVDFVSPHALLAEALGRFGARARLLARLGPEAAEPVDELLSAALRHADTHPPSLQGFLHWLRRSEESIKREPDAAGDAVRVMTVHGAKGLQARLVVLPDTTGHRPVDDTLLWVKPDARPDGAFEPDLVAPIWVPRAELGSASTRLLRDRMRADATAESNRLLYVALTRAADRLVVCGWESGRRTEGGAPEGSWYALCRAGFEAAGAVAQPFALPWPGERLVLAQAEPASAARPAPAAIAADSETGPLPAAHLPAALPPWTGRAPDWRAAALPAEPVLPQPLAPSRPDDVELGPVPALRSPLDTEAADGQRERAARRAGGFRRGRLLHALLQHLPDLPEERREEAALRFLRAGSDGLSEKDARDAADRLRDVLLHPGLEPLFATEALAEQPVSGLVDGVVVSGRIDRLRVLPDRVLLCDFKTNRRMPSAPERAPLPYLRQMAAYRALLAQLYPDRPVRCALVWTEEASVMVLPDALLERHRPGTYRLRDDGESVPLDQPPPVAHLD
ncbi:double-strand break repair helicase AddA [Acetobacteraceae bacterium KSS8]|uniref:DNA 3'-5' helicase n=1 Tax=Endosaccharibacter trunci TaxID=2812733 RepID=A0ABT1WA44_9PROT|nr:double-strand break repair helicase AddA [Acetobacteraceae bacterium KSS8]